MADVDIAVEYVLRQEDSKLSGVITRDSGGRTRFGVAEKFHPELTNTGFFDTMPTAQALEVAIKTYKNQYAPQLQLGKIISQAIANTFLSYAINDGTEIAIKLIQKLLGCVEDGEMGQKTLNAINTLAPTYLMVAWKTMMISHYKQIVDNNPSDSIYLQGWLNRVTENTKQLA